MNPQRPNKIQAGFTLVELLVAMAITTVIVTVLVSITSLAMDTWNRSRSELRAARQAKSMVDGMANDFEALVTRRSNSNEWLSAVSNVPTGSVNAAKLIFFTAATDRYNGNIGLTAASPPDNGGDVSCVAYQLNYRDPINSGTPYISYVMNRYLVDPDKTFGTASIPGLLGQPNLTTAFASYDATLSEPTSFVCENVFQFTVTFHVEATHGSGTTTQLVDVPVTIGKTTSVSAGKTIMLSELHILGTGIRTLPADLTPPSPYTVTADEFKAGRVKSVEIALTVLTDFGMDMIRKTPALAADSKFLGKNSYQYSKRVAIPSM